MTINEEDLKYLQTWAREQRGPGPHAYQPIENPNPFGTSPICKVCRQDAALCSFDQERPDIPRIVLGLISEVRRHRKSRRRTA
jgi:hypothetical protein